MERSANTFETEGGERLPYLLYEPEQGAPAPEAGRPLIVFLHGRDEAGGKGRRSEETLAKLAKNGICRVADEERLPEPGGAPFPALIACPQAEVHWREESGAVLGLIAELVRACGADPARVCLTGLSMGAGACWRLAAAEPERIAAILPLSAPVPGDAAGAATVPVWLFAGGADQFHAPELVRRSLAEVPRSAQTTLTIEPQARHEDGFWDSIYSRTYVYEWLLGRERG